jgi:hypothetical protein
MIQRTSQLGFSLVPGASPSSPTSWIPILFSTVRNRFQISGRRRKIACWRRQAAIGNAGIPATAVPAATG